jgi:hypothetical protein
MTAAKKKAVKKKAPAKKKAAKKKTTKVARAASTGMTDDVFWRVIAAFDWKKTGDDDAVMRPAMKLLAAMQPADIIAFEDLLAEKLYALDTREHCRACYRGELDPDDGDDYVSADGFLYSRCVVVANGRKTYERVLKRPAAFPRGLEFESLLYLASDAYEARAGDELDHATPVSWESFSNRAGWRPTPATKKGKFTGSNVPPMNRRPT